METSYGCHHAMTAPHRLASMAGHNPPDIRSRLAAMLDPKVLVPDEPVSALDLSTQSTVFNLLVDRQERLVFPRSLVNRPVGTGGCAQSLRFLLKIFYEQIKGVLPSKK